MDVRALDAKDVRRSMSRVAPDHYAANFQRRLAYNAIAAEVGCTPLLLAIAWLVHQGDDILPFPGTTRMDRLLEALGAAHVTLNSDVLARLDALINQHTVHGDRYNAQANSEVETEVF